MVKNTILHLNGLNIDILIIYKFSIIQKPVFPHISVLITKAECKIPESFINDVKHVYKRK